MNTQPFSQTGSLAKWLTVHFQSKWFLVQVQLQSLMAKCLTGEFSRDIEILGWCQAGPVLPHWEKVPL